MRGDQLARKWRIIRAVKTSSRWLTVIGIAQRDETGKRTIYPDLEAFQTAVFPLFPHKVERATRWAFIDTFKFKFFPLFSSIKLRSLSIVTSCKEEPKLQKPVKDPAG